MQGLQAEFFSGTTAALCEHAQGGAEFSRYPHFGI
jgi:hypothetical protein